MAAVLGGACGVDAPGSLPVGSCPRDLPGACPAAIPSWNTDVATVVHNRCFPCHSPGGAQANRPFTTYMQVFGARGSILNQVYACRMPPASDDALTVEERTALLAWLVCGAPAN